MEVGVANLIEEKTMLDGVESFGDVYRDHCRAERRFSFIEAVSDSRDGGEEGCSSRVLGSKAVLGWGRGERRREEGKNKTLKDLRGRAKEGDGAVRGGDRGGFTGLRDGNNKGLFPNRGEVRGLDREVKKRGEVGDGTSTKVDFQRRHFQRY